MRPIPLAVLRFRVPRLTPNRRSFFRPLTCCRAVQPDASHPQPPTTVPTEEKRERAIALERDFYENLEEQERPDVSLEIETISEEADFESEEWETEMELDEQTDDMEENALEGFLTLYKELRMKTNTTEVLDTLREKMPNRLMTRAELRVIMNILRTLLTKNIEIRRQVGAHSSWALLTAAFKSVKHEVPLQEITGMLTVVAFLNGHPHDLTADLFAELESHPIDIRNAKPWTVRSLLTSMSRMPQHVTPSLVRLVHEKVLADVDEFPVSHLAEIYVNLDQIQPLPTDGMMSIIYSRMEKNVSELNKASLIILCWKMQGMKQKPPATFLKAIFDKCMSMLHIMNAKFLTTFLLWMSSVRYPTPSSFHERIRPVILDLLDTIEGKRLSKLVQAYSQLRDPRDITVIQKLCDTYLATKDAHSVRTGNWLLYLFKQTKIDEPAKITAIVDASSECLKEATMTDIVFLFSIMAQMSIRHSCLEDVMSRLDHSPELSTEQVARIICSCARFRSVKRFNMRPYFTRVTAIASDEELKKKNPNMLIILTDALTKLKYRNVTTGLLLASHFEKLQKSLSPRQRLLTFKALLKIGGQRTASKISSLLNTFLLSEWEPAIAAEVSHAVEIVQLAHKYALNELLKRIVDLISMYRKSFSGEELAHVIRHGTRNPHMTPVLLDALANTALDQKNDMTLHDMSFALWGFAKARYVLERSLFENLASGIVVNLQTTDTFILHRYLLACGVMSHVFPKEMDAIAKRINSSSIEDIGIQTVGTFAWTAGKLGYKNEEVLLWMQKNIQSGVLQLATFCILSDIMFAFTKFDVVPSEAFLYEVHARTAGNFERLTPYEFSCLLSGLIKYGYKVSRQWIEEAISYFERHLLKFQIPSICFSLSSLVKIGYRPSKDTMAVCCCRISEKSHVTSMRHLASFIWACGQSKYHPALLFSGIESQILKDAEHMTPSITAMLVWGIGECLWKNVDVIRALASGSYDKMEKMTASEFSGCIWGLATSNYNEREFYLKAANVAFEKEKEMTADDLLLSIRAFASAKRPADLFLRQAINRLPNEINTYSSHQLFSLSWSLAVMRRYDIAVIQSLEESVTSKMKTFDTKELVVILHSFVILGHIPDSLNVMLNRIANIPSTQFSKSWTVLHLLWAYSQLSRRPSENILTALQENVTNAMPNRWKAGRKVDVQSGISSSQLIMSLWCLYSLGMRGTNISRVCARRSNELDILENMSDKAKSQLAQCLLLCTYTEHSSPLLFIPKHYRDEIIRSWQSGISNQAMQESSALRRDLASALEVLELEYKQRVISPDGNLFLDFVVANPDEASHPKSVVLHLCQKGDVFKNRLQLNGETKFQIRLKEAAGFHVIPVTESEWNEAARDGGSGVQYLWSLLTDHSFSLKEPTLNGQDNRSLADSVAVDPGAWVDSYEDGLQDDTADI